MIPKAKKENNSLDFLKLVLLAINSGLTSTYSISRELNINHHSACNINLIKRRLAYATKHHYLTKYGDSHKPHYQLTDLGQNKLNQLKFKLMDLDQNNWDGKWRIIAFDIPENRRLARDKIRILIKQLGLKKLQNSIWITPYNCREQFEQITSIYGVSKHLLLLEVTKFDQEHKYKKYWNL